MKHSALRIRWVRTVSCLCIASVTHLAFASGPQSVQRLATLCHVWNYARRFHFALVERSIDWDAALVRTIPMVESATTDRAFATAVNSMLSDLQDPETRVDTDLPRSPGRGYAPLAPEAALVRQGRTLVLCAFDLCVNALLDLGNSRRTLEDWPTFVEDADTVVLDLRCPPSAAASDVTAVRESMKALLCSTVSGPWRPANFAFRVTRGAPYEREDDPYPRGGTSNQTIESAVGVPLKGRTARSVDRVVLILNEFTPDEIVKAAVGARLEGRCSIVAEGSVGVSKTPFLLGGGAVAWIRDGRLGGVPDEAIYDRRVVDGALDAGRQLAVEAPGPFPIRPPTWGVCEEEPYDEMTSVSEPYRLLALFRVWGTIEATYPYLDLIKTPWDTVLTTTIPRFQNASDDMAYRLAVARLLAYLPDAHAYTDPDALGQLFGQYWPKLTCRTIQGRCLIVGSEIASVRPGEEVLEIDGETPANKAARAAPYLGHSSRASLRNQVDASLLATQRRFLVLKTRKVSGATALRRLPTGPERIETYSGPPVRRFRGGTIGYLDLRRLDESAVPKALSGLGYVRALIVDLRGYPQGGGFALASLLATKVVPVARIEARISAPASSGLSGGRESFTQTVVPAPGTKYRGEIAVLIDERSVSQAEHSCAMLSAICKVTFIGTRTQGTDGNLASVVLPQGLKAFFSGTSVERAGGGRLQGVGIKPDLEVSPTRDGLALEKDEVLDAAVEHLGRLIAKRVFPKTRI